MGLDSVKYDAFISYRHCELDSFVSENLHKKLENFKLPKSILKNKNLTKTKIERVFRDEAELPLSDNLSDPIMAALQNSEFLIVICTPRLPLSAWCKKEIETFVATHDRKHVLLVLAEGEPDDSFPEVLLYEDVVEKDLDGKEVTIRRPREPLAADCRGNNNKERLKAMDNVVIKLCAAMFNLNYDDIKQRHREQKIKRRILAMEIVMALVALFALVCILFTVRINKQNKIIQDKYASSMAAASEELYENGRRMDAIYAARSVLPDKESKGYNEEAYRALVDAMNVYCPAELYVPKGIVSIPSHIIDYRVSDDLKKMILYGTDEILYVCDIEKDEVIYSKHVLAVVDFDFSGSDGLIYAVASPETGSYIAYLNYNNITEYVLEEDTGWANVKAVPGKDITCTFSINGYKGYNGDSLEYETYFGEYDLAINEYCEYCDIAFSEDGNYAAFSIPEYNTVEGCVLCFFETDTGKIDLLTRDTNITDESCLATDGQYIFSSSIHRDPFTGEDLTFVYRVNAFDYLDTKLIGVQGEEMDNICLGDYGVVIYGNNEAMLIDYDLGRGGDTGQSILSTLTRANMILDVYYMDGEFYVIDSFGRMFMVDDFYPNGAPLTDTYFDENAVKRLLRVKNKGDILFVQHEDDGSYISVVEKEKGEWASSLSKTGMNGFDLSYINYPEFLDEIDVEKEYVYQVLMSDDKKYYSVQTYNGALTIYNAATKKEVKTIYLDTFPDFFVYLKKQKSYVLYSGGDEYLFDKKFNCYATLPYGTLMGTTDDKDSDLILSDGMRNYYRVEIHSYKDVIEKADEILGDYTPDNKVADKYNITVK